MTILKNNLLLYLILLILSTCFVILFSEIASPYILKYPLDSTMYLIMGQGVVDGLVPYRDIFDHKGPSIFFIEAIFQFFWRGRMGVFLLEVTNLFITLVFVYKSSMYLLRNNLLCVSIIFILLTFLRFFYYGGNTNEIICFSFLFIGLYCFVQLYFSETIMESRIKKYSFILGVCFSIVFWIRANNSFPLLGLVLFLFIVFFKNKRFLELKLFSIYSFIGLLPITIFYFSYFSYHQSIDEFLYGTFVHNFLYAKGYIAFHSQYLDLNLLLLGLSLLSGLLFFIKTKNSDILILVFIELILAYFTSNIEGRPYAHYYLMYALCIVLGLILLFYSIRTYSILKYIVFLSCFFMFGRILYYKRNEIIFSYPSFVAQNKEDIEYYNSLILDIPVHERNQIYPLGTLPDFYILTNTKVQYKYFTLGEAMSMVSDKVEDELLETFINVNSSPKWLIGMNLEDKFSFIPSLDSILKLDYNVVKRTDSHVVYRSKLK